MLEIEKENKKGWEKRELQFYILLTEDKICKTHINTLSRNNYTTK